MSQTNNPARMDLSQLSLEERVALFRGVPPVRIIYANEPKPEWEMEIRTGRSVEHGYRFIDKFHAASADHPEYDVIYTARLVPNGILARELQMDVRLHGRRPDGLVNPETHLPLPGVDLGERAGDAGSSGGAGGTAGAVPASSDQRSVHGGHGGRGGRGGRGDRGGRGGRTDRRHQHRRNNHRHKAELKRLEQELEDYFKKGGNN